MTEAAKRVLDVFHNYEVPIQEFLKRSENLENLSGDEKAKMQNQIAEWIETTCPLRKRKPANREFSDSELKAVNLVFGDSIYGSVLQARGEYEALKESTVLELLHTCLDIGNINEPEESDYRRISSARWIWPYPELSDEDILLEPEDKSWEYFRRAVKDKQSFRIWYSAQPQELCGLYYLCSLLVDYPGDVFAVRVPDRVRWKDEEKYRIVYESSNLDLDSIGRTVESSVKLSPMEIKMYADEWARLKRENAPLRTVIGSRVVSVNADFYDPVIWTYVPDEPETEKSVFEKALVDMPYVYPGWIAYRIHAMIDKGIIGVKEDNRNPAKRLICRKAT